MRSTLTYNSNCHVHELHCALQHISPQMSLVEGLPHMGATDDADFLATVRNQPLEFPLLLCNPHPAQREQRMWQGAHHVAGVLLPLRTDVPKWLCHCAEFAPRLELLLGCAVADTACLSCTCAGPTWCINTGFAQCIFDRCRCVVCSVQTAEDDAT